jgi:hypothetical protein
MNKIYALLLFTKMKYSLLIFTSFIIFLGNTASGQEQGFFLNDWKPATITSPTFTNTDQTTDPTTVSFKILFKDTLTKIPAYIFGDNANLYTGCMSNNAGLMKHITDRHLGVLRGPSGSISDVFFWNRNVNQRPADIPAKLAGQTSAFEPWYGVRPFSWETWTMAVDSFYSILKQTAATGMLTVNYGYARYGTGPNPVANAAHLAADWVRYDKGRSKFWEIGNEVFGNWEAGYRIDKSLNQDGQPEYINGTLYGQHCLVFIDSMRSAAAQVGVNIKIGLVMLDAYSSGTATWNKDVASVAAGKADFYIVHSYYTPYNQNSNVATILNSFKSTGSFKSYVWAEADKAGKPHLPVALTEYNIFAIGSNQPVSHVNGIHAVLVTGEAIKKGYGATLRWDLANGWDNGNDHGMFSYGSEPGVEQYAARPAFYHLYFQRRFTGDVMLNSTIRGDTNVVVFPTAFSSGQVAVTLVNRSRDNEVVRLNIQDFKFGSRYYTYTLTGEPGQDFSRKVYVNGEGNSLVAGGPENYESIAALSSLIGDEIRIKLPPLSSTFVLIEPGDKELPINEDVYGISHPAPLENIEIYPNPANGIFKITNTPQGITKIQICDMTGSLIYTAPWQKETYLNPEIAINLAPGIYQLILTGNDLKITKKLVIQ